MDQSEGRSVCLSLSCGLRVVGVYVPNSGQSLSRLDYRVSEWDKNLRSYLAERKGSDSVLLCGDLNVAHEDIDIWNAGTPRIRKQAGTTPQERESFSRFLAELDMVDAYRWLSPDVPDVYTFWSRRLRHREVNKGLRLDYFLVSRALAKGTSQAALDDCRILDGYAGSDHCPIVCSLRIC